MSPQWKWWPATQMSSLGQKYSWKHVAQCWTSYMGLSTFSILLPGWNFLSPAWLPTLQGPVLSPQYLGGKCHLKSDRIYTLLMSPSQSFRMSVTHTPGSEALELERACLFAALELLKVSSSDCMCSPNAYLQPQVITSVMRKPTCALSSPKLTLILPFERQVVLLVQTAS